MHRSVLTILLCLLAGSAAGETFELKDPAAEIYEEQETLPLEESTQPQLQEGMHCTVDTDSGECFCIGKKSARQAALSQAECMAEIRKVLENWRQTGGSG